MENSSALIVGDEFPNGTYPSTLGNIDLHALMEAKWCLIITFAANFDAVATTEVGAISKLSDEFRARGISVIGVSRDSVLNHKRWIREIEEVVSCVVDFPIISDVDFNLLSKLNTTTRDIRTHNHRVTSTATVITNLDKRVNFVNHYPILIGRNFYEILRVFDGLFLSTYNRVAVPSNWAQGMDVFVRGDVNSKEASVLFPKGFLEIKPWFRLTPPPDT